MMKILAFIAKWIRNYFWSSYEQLLGPSRSNVFHGMQCPICQSIHDLDVHRTLCTRNLNGQCRIRMIILLHRNEVKYRILLPEPTRSSCPFGSNFAKYLSLLQYGTEISANQRFSRLAYFMNAFLFHTFIYTCARLRPKNGTLCQFELHYGIGCRPSLVLIHLIVYHRGWPIGCVKVHVITGRLID